MSVNKPLINGTGYAWSSIRMNLFGRTVVGVTAIDYSNPQKKENNYGAGNKVVERAHGNYDPKLSITFLLKELFAIEADAKANGFNDLSQVPPFDVTIAYLNGTTTVTHVAQYVEFTDAAIGAKQGDTKIEVKCEMIVGDIIK